MKLIHRMPRCTPALRERIERLLDRETCNSYECGNQNCALRRRIVGGNEALFLQCTNCGRAVGGSLSKRECWDFDELDPWDTEAEKAWEAGRDERHSERLRELDARLAQEAQDREDRKKRYDNWLWTSPEWRRIRLRVLKRANYTCEHCLEAEAREVHHDTYQLGVLPPTWLLHAVCRACHLHLTNFKPVFV